MMPVRCFTCGAVVADKSEEYEEMLKKGLSPADALDKLGVKRYCCRRMFLSHVDIVDDITKYGKF
ncbi:MAG: DNA-directed RNA polymerase subunit N [Candidatus Micrarchaeota archaeon]